MISLFKKIFLTQVTGIFNIISGLITTFMLVYALNPADYGRYSLVISLFGLFSLFVGLNLFAYTRIKIPLVSEVHKYGYLKTQMILPFFVLIIFCFFSFVFRDFLFSFFSFLEKGPAFYVLFSLLILFDILLREFQRFFAALSRPAVLNGADIIFRSVYFILILFFLFWGRFSVEGVLLMFLISQISGIVFMLRHFDFALFLKGPFKRDVYEKGLVFGLMLFPLTLFTTLSATIDRTMIAAISGFEEVAAYSLAFRLIMPAMVVITGSVMLVLFPYIAAQWRPGQYMKAGVYHFTGLRLSAFLTLLFFVFLVLLSLFMHFPGIDSYLGAYKKTFLLLPFLGIMPLIECLFVSASNLLQIMNRTKGLLLAMPFFVVINVLLNYLLIPAYGAFGAAAATLAGYLSAAAGANVLLYRAIKKDKLKINIRIYLKPAFYGGLIIISGLGAVLSAILARPWGWPWGYLYVPAAILVYSVCFVLLLLRAGFIRPGDMRKLGGL